MLCVCVPSAAAAVFCVCVVCVCVALVGFLGCFIILLHLFKFFLNSLKLFTLTNTKKT